MRWGELLGAVILPLFLSACEAGQSAGVLGIDSKSNQNVLVSPRYAIADAVPAATSPTTRSDDDRPAEIIPPGPQDFRPLGAAGAGGPAPSKSAGISSDGPSDSANPSSDFYPTPDRWRAGIPGNYIQNSRNNTLFDPYGQNLLKGDYPLPGTQDKFLVLTLTSDTLLEARRTPTPSGVSTLNPGSFDFFGNGRSQIVQQNFVVSAELFKGDTAYQPRDWSFRATGVFNGNYVHTSELGLVKPDVREGRDRTEYAIAAQELFVEKKLADLSPNFDFVSVRAGIQGFNSDFRGFLFSDNEPGVRLFGNLDNNRIQYNLAWFYQVEKDTNSGLNTFQGRNQNVFLANIYKQDFLVPGYTISVDAGANIDRGGRHYDTNGFLVRPAPVGTIGDKKVDAYYLGFGGDGHIGRFNISHQFYQALGRENFNPIAGRSVEIDARFFAAELSYDMDWIRYHASFVYSSGDHNPQDGKANGFDSIFDNPNFAGGGFSYFTRQAIRLTGADVNVVNRNSLVPDLRTSKEQGQANFVNPGLFLYNLGADLDVTPELTVTGNVSYLRFDSTSALQLLLQDNKIGRDIGIDFGVGARYRPLLNNNLIFTVGASALVPGGGFSDLYGSATLFSFFTALTVTY